MVEQPLPSGYAQERPSAWCLIPLLLLAGSATLYALVGVVLGGAIDVPAGVQFETADTKNLKTALGQGGAALVWGAAEFMTWITGAILLAVAGASIRARWSDLSAILHRYRFASLSLLGLSAGAIYLTVRNGFYGELAVQVWKRANASSTVPLLDWALTIGNLLVAVVLVMVATAAIPLWLDARSAFRDVAHVARAIRQALALLYLSAAFLVAGVMVVWAVYSWGAVHVGEGGPGYTKAVTLAAALLFTTILAGFFVPLLYALEGAVTRYRLHHHRELKGEEFAEMIGLPTIKPLQTGLTVFAPLLTWMVSATGTGGH